MNVIGIDEKFIAYRKIINSRNICRVIVFVPPVIALFVGFFISEELFISLIKVVWIPYLVGLFVSVLTLMAVDCCPWCGKSFFCKQYGMVSTAGLGFFSGNTCASCNEPSDKSN